MTNFYQVGREYDVLTLPVGQKVPVPTDQVLTFPSGETIQVNKGDTWSFEFCGFKGLMPLLNNYARDDEFDTLLPTVPHTHIDWRFVPEAFYRKFKQEHYPWPIFGEIFILRDEDCAHRAKTLIQRKKMTCLREIASDDLPNYTSPNVLPLVRVLERLLKGKCITNTTCPHAGTSVAAMVLSPCGQFLTCPAHGLRFSGNTGVLVPYPKQVWEKSSA